MNLYNKANRIHIMGAAGSGKTTLAQQLSGHLDVPCYLLDKIAYEGGSGEKIPLDVKLESIRSIIAQPGWITEGAFLWWTDQLLEAADLIIWLDLPFRITAWRIVKRHVQLNLAGTNPHPGTVKLIRFLSRIMERQTRRTAIVPFSIDDDAATTRIAEAQFLGNYVHKVVHCTRPADVAELKTQIFSLHRDL